MEPRSDIAVQRTWDKSLESESCHSCKLCDELGGIFLTALLFTQLQEEDGDSENQYAVLLVISIYMNATLEFKVLSWSILFGPYNSLVYAFSHSRMLCHAVWECQLGTQQELGGQGHCPHSVFQRENIKDKKMSPDEVVWAVIATFTVRKRHNSEL